MLSKLKDLIVVAVTTVVATAVTYFIAPAAAPVIAIGMFAKAVAISFNMFNTAGLIDIITLVTMCIVAGPLGFVAKLASEIIGLACLLVA